MASQLKTESEFLTTVLNQHPYIYLWKEGGMKIIGTIKQKLIKFSAPILGQRYNKGQDQKPTKTIDKVKFILSV